MAYSFSSNNTPATGDLAMYLLISTLLTAGWTMPDASDGTTRAANRVTSGASGTNGLANANAWVRLQAPAVNGGNVVNQQREITIQRGASSRGWRIKYSASAGFTTGGSSTTTPSSADQVVMLGAGTDAAATFNTTWFATDGTYRWHIACGGAAEFYSFMAHSMTSATTTSSNGLFLDVLASGSYPSTDVDPAVFYVSSLGSASVLSELVWATGAVVNVTNPALARAWLGATSAAEIATTATNSQNVKAMPYGNSSASIGGAATLGSNPYTGKDDQLPLAWVRTAASTTPLGWKGFSTLFSWPSVVRTNMDTYDVAGTKDRAYLNQFAIPWSGLVPTI